MELLIFYKLSFVVALVSSFGLSLSGFHFISRSMILSVFLLSQFALLGHMIATIIFGEQLFFSLFFSLLFYFFADFVMRKRLRNLTQNSHYVISGYLALTAVQFLLISLVPALDAHVNAGFFGNMVTATNAENIFAIIVFTVFIAAYMKYRRVINKETFELAVLDSKPRNQSSHYILTIPTVVSLFSFGFLYTLGFLLIPSIMLAKRFSNQFTSLMVISIISMASGFFGLLLSISFERLPTTPAQIICLVSGCLLVIATTSLRSKLPKRGKTPKALTKNTLVADPSNK